MAMTTGSELIDCQGRVVPQAESGCFRDPSDSPRSNLLPPTMRHQLNPPLLFLFFMQKAVKRILEQKAVDDARHDYKPVDHEEYSRYQYQRWIHVEIPSLGLGRSSP
jgi:hypothetical protein